MMDDYEHEEPYCCFCRAMVMEPYIICKGCMVTAEQGPVTLCLHCFAKGIEFDNHHSDHPYSIVVRILMYKFLRHNDMHVHPIVQYLCMYYFNVHMHAIVMAHISVHVIVHRMFIHVYVIVHGMYACTCNSD